MSGDKGDTPTTAPRPDALLAVYLRLRPTLERVMAHRTGDRATAADLVQDLYLRLQSISVRLSTQEDAQRYMMRMAINASTDHLRQENRRAELLLGLVDLFDVPERGPEEQALTEDQLRSVDAALADLPDKCRQILFLSRVEGLTHGEIAQRLGVSRSLVEKYAVMALVHCQKKLAGDA